MKIMVFDLHFQLSTCRVMSVTLHTSVGDLQFVLHCRSCPRAAFNFLALAASGYYDGTKFHRNIPRFIAQGGDPTGTGKGGASVYAHYRNARTDAGSFAASSGSNNNYFDDEGFGETFHNRRGVISMAHRGTRANTNASQFFVSYGPHASFDGTYTAFGELQGGEDVLDAVERCAGEDVQVDIRHCTVTSNPFAEMEIPFDPTRV